MTALQHQSALAEVKRACARVNGELGLLPADKAAAIIAAATSSGAPSVGVGLRAAPTTLLRASTTIASKSPRKSKRSSACGKSSTSARWCRSRAA